MAKYSYFLGQSGGSGGGGDFALIKIEYPAGQPVTVTFDGDTIEAPDDSGLWLFGCEETGTYTIAITGTTAEVEVEITTKGQIETIWVSPQVINYALIYYLGNEFAEPTEEEKKYAIKTGGWEQGPNTSKFVGLSKAFSTKVNINFSEFSSVFLFCKTQKITSNDEFQVYIELGSNEWTTEKIIDPASENYHYLLNYNLINERVTYIGKMVYLNNISASYSQNRILAIGCGGSFNHHSSYLKYGNQRIISFNKQENNLLANAYRYNGSSDVATGNVYYFSVGFVKVDNISGLSAYGSTISEILNNASSLFDDTVALNWMVLNCTGDFMISALSNSNFVNAMNASVNKTILVANEHWNRFLALLSV